MHRSQMMSSVPHHAPHRTALLKPIATCSPTYCRANSLLLCVLCVCGTHIFIACVLVQWWEWFVVNCQWVHSIGYHSALHHHTTHNCDLLCVFVWVLSFRLSSSARWLSYDHKQMYASSSCRRMISSAALTHIETTQDDTQHTIQSMLQQQAALTSKGNTNILVFTPLRYALTQHTRVSSSISNAPNVSTYGISHLPKMNKQQ